MKIRITESQLKRIVTEEGGYDDRNIMNIHAQSVQEPLLQTFGGTVEILKSFIDMSMMGKLNKENLKNFISNLTTKLSMDIDMINRLENEIYVDRDFKKVVKDYKVSLKKLQNYLRLLYSGDFGMVYDMTEQEIIKVILGEIEKLESDVENLSRMMKTVHNRYRNRLGLK
jgi:galactose-1-phosphate uridylyltransferase